MRRLLAAAGIVGGALAALAFFRRGTSRRERVDLYFDDGSMLSLSVGSPDGQRLLPLAREILETARG